ncbi:hypothetical protein [Vreelandella glaciei]|uniref:hypothetical protein n=1 Tax=Vreelandella glaciei TaxID=186761 RepID=UPI0030025FB5
MSALKPIDHQNIVMRLMARTAPSTPAHLTTLAHAHKLPVSLHQVRVACDALVEQQFAERYAGYAYRLTVYGARELPALPLLGSYYIAGGASHAAK